MHACTTHADAFAEFGIDDGTDLIHRTYYRLRTGEYDPGPDAAFAAAVARSFRAAFIAAADHPVVPEEVDGAIDDAEDVFVHRLLGTPAADLRTALLPAFYRTVASTYCAGRRA